VLLPVLSLLLKFFSTEGNSFGLVSMHAHFFFGQFPGRAFNFPSSVSGSRAPPVTAYLI
jgi:hypothetical protein